MLTKKFNYNLPKALIAQKSIHPRDHSRLLVFSRKSGRICHDYFYNLGKYLRKGDILALNDSKVIPARLTGRKASGGRKIEVFLLKRKKKNIWQCLLGGKKRNLLKEIEFENSDLKAEIIRQNEDKTWQIKFNFSGRKLYLEIEKIGQVPTPPYIKSHKNYKNASANYYQTIYAKKEGSVAAPTAGFHFTQNLINKLKKRGVKFVFLTLHIGLGTFTPIREKRAEEHRMHAEWFELDKKTADILNLAKTKGQRIVAVGTTATRVLESCFRAPLSPTPKKIKLIPYRRGETKIFIKPGYRFKFVDVLITNFHLPCSTPLLLAAAFCQNGAPLPKARHGGTKGGSYGRDLILKAYKEAIKKKYRFYSFGDAMLIL